MKPRTKRLTLSTMRTGLLLGTSIVGLCATHPAAAQSISALRGNIAAKIVAPVAPRPPAANPLTGAQRTGMARAMVNQTAAQQRYSLATQAQAAAKAAGSARAVPNGLRIGGLMPVSNPVRAALDTADGLHTWQGASVPTEKQNGDSVDVTITQTERRAILSWESFNVGAKTTLTFEQKDNGVAQKDWIALNRIVGAPGEGPSASTILGSIKADGTVLVLNRAGVLFGAGSVVNTHALAVSSLEIGRNRTATTPLTLRERNDEFLTYGLLGFRDQAAAGDKPAAFTFSPERTSSDDEVGGEGAITFDAGSTITSGDSGYIIALAPQVSNYGSLTSANGQVSLQSGRRFFLDRSEGNANSPFVRGLVITSDRRTTDVPDFVVNGKNAIISSDHGYISLGASIGGAVLNSGLLRSSTSVARNGYIGISGGNIRLDPGSLIHISADSGTETIPQGAESVANFKTSQIAIGNASSRIEIGADSLLLAPSANVTIGAPRGPDSVNAGNTDAPPGIFIDASATIDVSGIKDFVVPASRNLIRIDPVKGNELRDSPAFRTFLNGATVVVDPRLSGVREDGVRWVGSPLIEAESYYAQVGVSAAELMTRGGNVSLGVASFNGSDSARAPSLIVKNGATIDISGGWVRYEGGLVETTRLITRNGGVVDIGSASLEDSYIGIVTGYTESYPRQGASRTYTSPIRSGGRLEGAYTEGRDAGSLTLKGSVIAFDGTLQAQAYSGERQIVLARPGTGSSSVYGDIRRLQAAPSELPAGGYLNVQALGQVTSDVIGGGGDIRIGAVGSFPQVAGTLAVNQSFVIDGDGLSFESGGTDALLSLDRRETIQLSDGLINDAGLSQLNLQTSGAITLDAGAAVKLDAGGAFTALAGRTITIDGSVTTPGGAIGLQTVQLFDGSLFRDDPVGAGSFDILVNGTLSTRGRWANDFGSGSLSVGGAYLDGGSVSMAVASRVTIPIEGTTKERLDVSGSILINPGALIDVSGGGYVDRTGNVDTSARGGNVSLISQTNYFQLSPLPTAGLESDGNVPGIRVTTHPKPDAIANPSQINARISIAEGSILAHSFGGGGTFTLETPAFSFGSTAPTTGTALPLDFFSRTGFGTYDITSFGTKLIENRFDNALGGYNAILATQTLTVGRGEQLRLSQTRFDSTFTPQSASELRNLATSGDLYSVLTPVIPNAGFDRLGIDLRLGGLLELHVDRGGQILGDAGAAITASKFWNEGTVRLLGGSITQRETLPTIYGSAVGAARFEDFFTVESDGRILEKTLNPRGIENAQYALGALYLTGLLAQNEGIRLSKGSVTDLSGISLRNPRLPTTITGMKQVNGRLLDGGSLITSAASSASEIFQRASFGEGIFGPRANIISGQALGREFTAQPGSLIDISGASDVYSVLTTSNQFFPQQQWSAGGSLYLGAGGSLSGSLIDAHGGADQALGGTLTFLNPILTQTDDGRGRRNVIAADQIEASGFDTFVAMGMLTGRGDVGLSLDRAFFLQSRPLTAAGSMIGADASLTIEAPYIRLSSLLQSMPSPALGTFGDGKLLLAAQTIDISGAVLFNRSIAKAELRAARDLRLIGALPFEQALGLPSTEPSSLLGQLVVNGDLKLTAGQIYPTTGSTFLIASAASGGLIEIARPVGANSANPYSAGGQLLIQANRIIQGGTVRVPLGGLTLGGNAPLIGGSSPFTVHGNEASRFAPATTSIVLAEGSITSVSANGLSIPYGTTTDQIEWYFSPTSSDPLTAPPTGVLTLAGKNVELAAGATVDIKGGGDAYAYEFVPGTGGSRDVLDRFNNDPYSSNNGLQYPDGRQIYAIVPGLSAEAAAAFDPLYSADYGTLYGPSDVGKSVYLDAAPGLAAGWYTLLPAKYAMLPGGRRIVEMTDSVPPVGLSGRLADGSAIVSGRFGYAGTTISESGLRTFSVQTQAEFRKYSNIVTTSANDIFAARAARNGLVSPRLPMDAGRLVLQPINQLLLEAELDSRAAKSGRSALVDISGEAFRIVSEMPAAPPATGEILLTAGGLSGLNAGSLFIGGTRTENADGTTGLDIRAHSITIENDSSHVLSAPELLFATDVTTDRGANLVVADGAAIVATGTGPDATGDYIVDGKTEGMTGQGSILRVANGPERLVLRSNMDAVSKKDAPIIRIGTARLSGSSILIGGSGDFRIRSAANLVTQSLALEAADVNFGANSDGKLGGLVVTPNLQAKFAEIEHLSIRTAGALKFENGSYAFKNVLLDSAGFASLNGGETPAVSITANSLELANSTSTLGACTRTGALACGNGSLDIVTGLLEFRSGTVGTYGFGENVRIQANRGIRYSGVGGLNVGDASLTFFTRSIADAANPILPDLNPVLPSLTLTSTGRVRISGTSGIALEEGTPGAKLAISGSSVSVSGTRLRATAGQFTVNAVNNIIVSDGAMLEAPAYSKQFGDAVDPYAVSAPGGRLALITTNGDIRQDAASTFSVGGTGQAGLLSLSAANGNVALGGKLNGVGTAGGGSFALETGGAFDLTGFASTARGFTGALDIRTGTGDLTLAAGARLDFDNVLLAAEAGLVDIAGTIDTSGVNGGDISLFGRRGVTLRATAFLDASADGYADLDSRQALAGDILLGTDTDGLIDIAGGARIDVTAKRPGNRLIPVIRNGQTLFSYVDTDQGGVVTLRAPIIEQPGSDTVNIRFSGSINGARQINVEAFKRWDLDDIAADAAFTGVTISKGEAVLDTGQASAGRVNFLSDIAAGTIPTFIRDFDISGANANLGGLTDNPAFVAQPGVELIYDGDIRLASNWNFGAATVDIDAAVTGGAMRASTLLPGKFIVNEGHEADLLENYASFLYRVGGKARGASGVLRLRASGDLTIAGSISDGMFSFGDQSDPDYLAKAMGGNGLVRQFVVPFECQVAGRCAGIANYPSAGGLLAMDFGALEAALVSRGVAGIPMPNDMPFSASANSAAALGTGPDGAGDPLGSAALFPLLSDGSAMASWSYNVVAGADLSVGPEGATAPSIDPLRTSAASSANVSVVGESRYTYGGSSVTYLDKLLLNAALAVTPSITKFAFADLVGTGAEHPTAAGYTQVDFDTEWPVLTSFLSSEAKIFFASKLPSQYSFNSASNPTRLATSAQLLQDFLTSIEPRLTALILDPANGIALRGSVTGGLTAFVRSFVRTGTGDINVAASGNIDLRNGSTITTRPVAGRPGTYQVGGTAIYTVGRLADMGIRTATDMATGLIRTVDPSAYLAGPVSDAEIAEYTYGRGTTLTGVWVADPVYASGGGDIAISARAAVFGRRDIYNETRFDPTIRVPNSENKFSFIGTGDQPWRIGSIGQTTNLRINPQLFTSGVGALGGGSVSVSAGTNVSDLLITSLSSVTTADVLTPGTTASRSLVTWGGGDLDLAAGGNLFGGRIDIARGSAAVSIGGSILSGGTLANPTPGEISANLLRIRLSDATVDLDVGGTALLQGISALGANQSPTTGDSTARFNSFGFYSPYSAIDLTANGAIIVRDQGATVTTTRDIETQPRTAVYPATLNMASLTGDLALTATRSGAGAANSAQTINLFPSAIGQLRLFAGGDIPSTTITMEDRDPGFLPGFFSVYSVAPRSTTLQAGQDFNFPAVLPDTTNAQRAALHNPAITHLGDTEPVRIGAGGDIVDMILSSPKQVRIGAGRDVLNMMLFAQNIADTDTSRVVSGRDIIATTRLTRPLLEDSVPGNPLPALQGNTFVIGGPGEFSLEAGRDAGPFLNSAVANPRRRLPDNSFGFPGQLSMGGGILSIGNEWNPALGETGASLNVMFGVAKGVDYAALRETYLNPANVDALDGDLFVQVEDEFGNKLPDRTRPIYAPLLIGWMKANAASELRAAYGTTDVDYRRAFNAFTALPLLRQRSFLINDLYFNELEMTSRPDGPSYLQYSRGYKAVNTLFSPDLGYTKNNLEGGSAGAGETIATGNLDLRLATIQTSRSGGISLLGPGGRILAGSTVRTADQAARRSYDGTRLFSGDRAIGVGADGSPQIGFSETSPARIISIPTGYEGIITLRGGPVRSFTDGSLLLNQSRLFTQAGGDITLWSSNGDLNAGQGPKSAANFPPVVVRINENAFSQVDAVGGVAGAGIAAFLPAPGVPAPDVFLIAPRGTVDAGDAGVRVAGNLFVAAAAVANADNFKVSGTSIGVVAPVAVDSSAAAASSAASAAAVQAAEAASRQQPAAAQSQIFVDVQGYVGPNDEQCKQTPAPAGCPAQ